MAKRLTIAIDFDDTLTADPKLWLRFIQRALESGHRVILVTQRRSTDENIAIIDEYLAEHGFELSVYFTDLRSKLSVMEERGIRVDIWIDDDPSALVMGR